MAFFPAESVIKMFFTRSEFVTKLGEKKVQNIQVTRQFIFRFDLILCFNECWNLAEVTRKDTSWRFLARRPSSRIRAHDFFLWSLNWLGQKMVFFISQSETCFPKCSKEQSLKKKLTCKTVTFLTLLHDQKDAILELWFGTYKHFKHLSCGLFVN